MNVILKHTEEKRKWASSTQILLLLYFSLKIYIKYTLRITHQMQNIRWNCETKCKFTARLILLGFCIVDAKVNVNVRFIYAAGCLWEKFCENECSLLIWHFFKSNNLTPYHTTLWVCAFTVKIALFQISLSITIYGIPINNSQTTISVF